MVKPINGTLCNIDMMVKLIKSDLGRVVIHASLSRAACTTTLLENSGVTHCLRNLGLTKDCSIVAHLWLGFMSRRLIGQLHDGSQATSNNLSGNLQILVIIRSLPDS